MNLSPALLEKAKTRPSALSSLLGLESEAFTYRHIPRFSYEDYLNWIITNSNYSISKYDIITGEEYEKVLNPEEEIMPRTYYLSGKGAAEEDMLFMSPNLIPSNIDELKARQYQRINNPRKSSS